MMHFLIVSRELVWRDGQGVAHLKAFLLDGHVHVLGDEHDVIYLLHFISGCLV